MGCMILKRLCSWCDAYVGICHTMADLVYMIYYFIDART